LSLHNLRLSVLVLIVNQRDIEDLAEKS